ncbi:MAG: hypothetical protein K0R65_413 [Crocinitomicaceae bacterium]|jgi:hypothetical protein|nr:hypothetical protein [Crocinitomicaceae bacterium]
MSKLLFILFICSAFFLEAQSTYEIERSWADNNSLVSSFKNPFQHVSDSGLVQKNKWRYGVAPEFTAALEKDRFVTLSGLQLVALYDFNPKWNVKLSNKLLYGTNPPVAYQSRLQSRSFFAFDPIYNDLRARVSYQPNRVFNFQAGIDKHFLGEGDRSLLLGNQGIPAPFVSMKANFWKLEYLNLQQIWREGGPGHYIPKANSTHYLNFNHENKISIGIFETVVHGIKDTLYNRGYEVEYLNPLIFYRPQEYSLGSSDNVLLGLNGFISWKNNTLYGQFMLDDINIQEIRKRSKWWANKYGLQAGYKAWFNIRNTPVFIRTEVNLVTPFSYASMNESTNYTNQGLPVAHPLGANFVEWYNEFSFNIKRFSIHAWGQVYMKGNDPAGSPYTYGGDPNRSYMDRPLSGTVYQDYGYYIGVGQKSYTAQFGANVSTRVSRFRWNVFAEPRLYVIRSLGKMQYDPFITVGIQSAIFSDKRNY